ncbi:MAG: C39 family peptidase [Anaerolineales bacterium]|nr:C39 family peptidase [Anaerolineales bacterium]
MPNVLLPVPHFEQSRDGYCLPACVQMVLASFWGNQYNEATLAKILATKQYGTPIYNAKRLQQEGYQVVVSSLTKAQLESCLVEEQPVITRVWTAMLNYWDTETSHVVVVVGCNETAVFLNDPSLSAAPQMVVWDAFLAAWAEYDETAVILSKI